MKIAALFHDRFFTPEKITRRGESTDGQIFRWKFIGKRHFRLFHAVGPLIAHNNSNNKNIAESFRDHITIKGSSSALNIELICESTP